MNVEFVRKSTGCDVAAPVEDQLLRALCRKIALLCVLVCYFSLGTFSSQAQISNQPGANSAQDDLSHLLKVSLEARSSGDPVAIGRASERVLALGLVQMAKIQLDAKDFTGALNRCRESLEFENSAQTRVELAIVSFYARKLDDAVVQANAAAEMEPANGLAWTIKGESLLGKKDYEGAVAALLQAIDAKRDAESLYSLGMAYLGLGEKQKASGAFSQVLALSGDAGWSRVLIGRAYAEQKFPPEAVEEFKTALQRDPRTPNAHYYWARTLLQQSDWSPTPEVREQLQQELKLNSRHFLANYLMGIFESIERNYSASDRYLHLTSEVSPNLPEPWMYLGLNANALGDKQSAEKYFRKAVKLREEGRDSREHLSVRRAYIALGRILLASGRKTEGERFLDSARQMQVEDLTERQQKVATIKSKEGTGVPGAIASDLSSVDSSALLSFGSDSGETQQRDGGQKHVGGTRAPASMGEAESRLRSVLGSAYNDLATAEALQEKYDLALKHYLAADSWDPRIPGLQRNLGLAYFYAGESARAIPILEKAILREPKDSQARATLGEAYFANKSFAKAAQVLSPISLRAEKDSRMGYVLAKSFAETGRKKEASLVLKKSEPADAGSNVELLVGRARLWKELGEPEVAAQCFRRVLAIDPGNRDANCALNLTGCPAPARQE